MLTELLAALCLSLAIACSWNRFRTIFSQATDNTVLLSPATTLASTICLSASALAFAGNNALIGCATIALGLAFSAILAARITGTPLRVTVATISLLSYAVLSAAH